MHGFHVVVCGWVVLSGGPAPVCPVPAGLGKTLTVGEDPDGGTVSEHVTPIPTFTRRALVNPAEDFCIHRNTHFLDTGKHFPRTAGCL